MKLGKTQISVLACFREHESGFSIYPIRQRWVWTTYNQTLRHVENLHEKGLLRYDEGEERYFLSREGREFLKENRLTI